jgi:endonuclease YncB( thermonuclease family)
MKNIMTRFNFYRFNFYRFIFIFYFIPLWALSLPNFEVAVKISKCTVIRVLDGDTITVNCSGVKERIRFKYIDAPESSQLGPEYYYQIGKWSTDKLKERVKINSVVFVHWSVKDIYKRILGVVYHRGVDLNRWMLERGMATIYQYTQFKPARLMRSYYFAMLKAAANSEGIWGLEKWQNPYFYRRSQKHRYRKYKLAKKRGK